MPARLNVEPGMRFGRLVIVGEASPISRTPHRGFWRMIELRCDCGGTIATRLNTLQSGRANSCGCLVSETNKKNGARYITHGETRGARTPEYRIWRGIKQRCMDQNSPAWKYYGGRGITICDQWRDNYQVFLNDVGRRPSPNLSIDRINNDRGYEPGNTRWATKSQQAYNRRPKQRIK